MARSSSDIAKLAAPVGKGVVPRGRLFGLLDTARDCGAIWVVGAPGIGKTTLVASYLQARALNSTWYHIDGGDADTAAFFYYLAEAACQAKRARKNSLPLLRPEYLPDIQGFARRFFRQLFAVLPKPHMLVFDNVHLLQEHAATRAALAIACEEAPAGSNVLAISRVDPPAELYRLIAGRAVTVLDEQLLRLTLEEASQIAAAQGETGQDIRLINEAVQGWAAGLVLLLHYRKHAGSGTSAAAWASRQALFNYFTNEAYAGLRPEIRDLLIRTALLPHFTVRMAEDLTGQSETHRWLEELCRQHHFIARRSGAEATYEYHALFREFLLARGREELNVVEYRAVVVHAARLLETDGLLNEALSLYEVAGNHESAIQLIDLAAADLLRQGRGQTLRGWIEQVPKEIAATRPWLLYWYGVSLAQTNPEPARQALQQAFAVFGAQRDDRGQLLTLAGIVESYYFEWADFRPLDRWIPEFERLLARHSEFNSAEVELRVYSSLLISLMYRQPTHSRLALCAARVAELVVTEVDINQRVAAATFLLDYYSSLGLYEQAQQVVVHIEPVIRSSALTAFNRVRWLSEHAYLLSQQGNFTGQAKMLDQAQEIATTHGLASTQVNILFSKATESLAAGDIGAGRQLVADIERILDPARRVDAAQYHYLRCSLALLQGDVTGGLWEARYTVELGNETGVTVVRAFYLCLLTCLLIENSDFERAQHSLRDARAAIADMHYPLLEYQIAAIQAYRAFKEDNIPAGRHLLKDVLEVGRREGYLPLFRALPRPTARLCAEALEAGIEPDYVRNIIARRSLRSPSQDYENWPWPLRVHSLGTFRIELHDVPLRANGKAQRRPMNLLKAIVAFGGREVGTGTLIPLLWGDSEGDDAQSAFDVGLHRLRKLLSCEDAIFLDNGRLTLNPEVIWVDVWALERLLAAGERMLKQGEDSAQSWAAHIESLFSLYRGHFLQMEGDEPWMFGLRDKLRSRFLRHLVALGRRSESRGDWDEAAELYQRGIELDNLAEELYRLLMVTYQKRRQPAGAIEVYRRCRQMLSVVLSVKPSAETEALYEAIRRA